MDELDKLLSELQDEYSNPQANTKSNLSQQNLIPKSIASPSRNASAIDRLLDDVKSDFEKRDLVQSQRQQQELQAEQARTEQLDAKRKEGLKKEATSWLENLDPFSAEGLWFEWFAEGYPSKLEAAVEYLSM